jgi:hypothetical protein
MPHQTGAMLRCLDVQLPPNVSGFYMILKFALTGSTPENAHLDAICRSVGGFGDVAAVDTSAGYENAPCPAALWAATRTR